MYGIHDYGQMIADERRLGAYSTALQRAIRPDSVVLDLGTGTGIFALLACRYGARRVYAVETSDAIGIAQRLAAANGFSDRIEFIQRDSTVVTLPERADVLVSDMHGNLPLFSTNLASIIDARRRLLAPGATLIPRSESLWAAPVEDPQSCAGLTAPWEAQPQELDLRAGRGAALNEVTSPVQPLAPEQLLAAPQCWCRLDYAVLEAASHHATLAFTIARSGNAHGVLLWFDSELADGIGLSNAPGRPALVYGSALLPLAEALPVAAGDRFELRLRADFTGRDYLWSWDSTLSGAVGRKAAFRQSSFFGMPPGPQRLRRRSAAHRPSPGVDAEIDRSILESMDGRTTLEAIAQALMQRFPQRFASYGEALARAGDLSERYDSGP